MVTEMSVCCLCGDKGKVKELIRCVKCRFHVSVVHRYCLRSHVDETTGWTCEDCIEEKMTQLREASRKSSRIQDRWIKRSNIKGIIKPKKEVISGSGLVSFCGDAKGSLEVHRRDLEQCIEKKSMPLVHQPIQSKRTSRITSGWSLGKKISDKTLNLGFHDLIFRKESKVRSSKESDSRITSNKKIKAQGPSLHSPSIPLNDEHAKNSQQIKLVVDYSDIFGDEDYAISKTPGRYQNAQYSHRQVELGKDTSSYRSRESGHDEDNPRVIKPSNTASLDNKRGQFDQTLELMDPSIKDVQHDATDSQRKRISTQVVQDWPQRVGPSNTASLDNKRGQSEIPLELMDPSIMDAQHDATDIQPKRRSAQVVRDRPQRVGPSNTASLDNRRGQSELTLELMDPSIRSARHDLTNINGNRVTRPLEYVPAKPLLNPVWRGHVHIQFRSYNTDMNLYCCRSTKSSSKVSETVRGMPNTITFFVKCLSSVWPRRFYKSEFSDKAIDVYLFPKNDKDAEVYDEILDHLIKHELALLYEMPSKLQNLVIFPSRILPKESHITSMHRNYYMWGALDEKE